MAARTLFIEGPAGVGKTTYALRHIRDLLAQGTGPETMLVLVPQRALGRPYQAAFTAPDWPGGAQIDVVTLGGLARRGLETFWPLVAKQAGFAHPEWEPIFLTIETAQYYMARFVNTAIRTGVFDSLNLEPAHIMRQTLDNLSKAAVNSFPLDEVADRLIAAWGDRHSSRPPVYRASLDVAQEFRDYCLETSFLDFSFQIELYIKFLLNEPLYRVYFTQRYRHLIGDNLEENFPVVGDFIRWAWDDLDSALLLYDTDAGYRVFLGADPGGMYELKELCADTQVWRDPVNTSPVMVALTGDLAVLLDPGREKPVQPDVNPLEGLVYESFRFYPEMIDWVVDSIAGLVDSGVPPREIVVLAPFLGDALRFGLSTRLNERGIETVSHRPSRALRDEPAARAILTLMALAHPEWSYRPPVDDVTHALQETIDGLDPVRAWLLTQIVYRPSRDDLGSFDIIKSDIQQRITFQVGERYHRLREWLLEYGSGAERFPPDHFLSRLFGDVLAQPGYSFHTNLDAGRVVAELVESGRKFRQTISMYHDVEDWSAVLYEYFSLAHQGMLAALYVASWRDEEKDAVFLAPAYTFLMRNRRVDYQFWLDAGSDYWWERLEQPLTHPYVLTRSYPPDQNWTDDLEFAARRDALCRLVTGLVRRCNRTIYISISNLGISGYEQRGPLLRAFQQLVQRYPAPGGLRS
ncbi:MAG: hypothetical protein JXJ20_05925 [Anaerolineae bacterium]|nr:hypothetical protein [Anaerolineae bacterium]